MIGDDENRNEFMLLASAGVIERAGMGETVDVAAAVPEATLILTEDAPLPIGDATPVATTLFNETVVVDEGPEDALLEFDDASDDDDLLTEEDFAVLAELGPVDIAATSAVRENAATTAAPQPIFQTLGAPEATLFNDAVLATGDGSDAAPPDAEVATDEGPVTAVTETDNATTDDGGEGLPTDVVADPAAQAGPTSAAGDAAECPDAMEEDAGNGDGTPAATATAADSATVSPTAATEGVVQPLSQEIVAAATAGDAEAAADAAAAAVAENETAPVAPATDDAPATDATPEAAEASDAAPETPAEAIANAAADAMADAIMEMSPADCPMDAAMAMMMMADAADQTITVDAEPEAEA